MVRFLFPDLRPYETSAGFERMDVATLSAETFDHRYRIEAGGCPVEAAFDLLTGRWKGLLLFRLVARGPQRFHELRKGLPHVSQRMLVRQLRELERDGLILRAAEIQGTLRVEYSATDSARELWPLLVGLRDWAARHLGVPMEGATYSISPPSQSVARKPSGRKPAARR